jgi:glycine/D-amino acid oxidase-like deaminating enzyme
VSPVANADVVVVGAGIVGVSIAREIASRAPEKSVVVLDRDTAGCGASRRSAGLHFPRGSSERVRRMTAYSQDYYEALKAERPSLPIHPLPMSVVAPEAHAGQLAQTYLDDAKLARADDRLDTVTLPQGAAVWTVDGCHYADVHALVQALAHELRPRVGIREGVRVAAIEPAGDGTVVRLGCGDAVTASQVVLAPGPWLAADAWRTMVAPLGVRVKKVVALHIEERPTESDRVIVFEDEDAFLLPLFHRGHWLFSYTCQEWDVDPDAIVDGLSARNLDAGREVLRRYAPALAERCVAGRVFCDAYSTDRQPVVRALDADGRVVFAGAANGSGYRLAPAIAAEAADLLHIPSRVRKSA